MLTRRACSAAPPSRGSPRASPAPPTRSTTRSRRIARARAPVHTLQGPFTQTRTIGLLATDVRSTGTLILVRPDRLRWELAAPDSATFFVGPEGLSYRGPSGRPSAVPPNARIAGALDDLRTLLGGDLGRLRERWDLRLLRDDATGTELQATPRAASPLRSMQFALAADSGASHARAARRGPARQDAHRVRRAGGRRPRRPGAHAPLTVRLRESGPSPRGGRRAPAAPRPPPPPPPSRRRVPCARRR